MRLRQKFETENDGEEFDPSGQPTVTPMLKSADGGIKRVLEAIRAHDNEDAREFIELHDSLSSIDRKHLSLEEIAVAAGIGAMRLAEIAVSSMIAHGETTSKLMIAASMQKVIKATVKAATDQVPIMATIEGEQVVVGKTNGDTKAMELFGKMSGLVPTPKGSTIMIQNNVAAEKEEEGEKTIPAYLDASQRLRMIHEAYDQRRLPAPHSDTIDVGSRIDNMQMETAEILRSE